MAETRYIEGQGRYALAEMVGRGGFATVWRARAVGGPSRGGDVAVKVIPVYSSGERSRALREGQIAEGLRHENIVETLEVIAGDHDVYLITEYVRGMPLDEAARAYDAEEIVDALSQILAALVHAHGQGVIHRDIKPQNALVDARGTVKLTDFGVAYRAGDTRLTRVGFAVGTPGYIAPEILDGADPSALTDIYAVGATARTLLAHQPYEPPPRLREFVNRATSPNPAHRPQSAWAALKLLTGRKAPPGVAAAGRTTRKVPATFSESALRLINGLAAGYLGFVLTSSVLGRNGAEALGVAAGFGVAGYLLPRLAALGVIVALAVALLRNGVGLGFAVLVPAIGGSLGRWRRLRQRRRGTLSPGSDAGRAARPRRPRRRPAAAAWRAYATPGGRPLRGGRGPGARGLRPDARRRAGPLLRRPVRRDPRVARHLGLRRVVRPDPELRPATAPRFLAPFPVVGGDSARGLAR